MCFLDTYSNSDSQDPLIKNIDKILEEDTIASRVLTAIIDHAKNKSAVVSAEGLEHGVYNFVVGWVRLYFRVGISPSRNGYCAVLESEVEKYGWWKEILSKKVPSGNLIIQK